MVKATCIWNISDCTAYLFKVNMCCDSVCLKLSTLFTSENMSICSWKQLTWRMESELDPHLLKPGHLSITGCMSPSNQTTVHSAWKSVLGLELALEKANTIFQIWPNHRPHQLTFFPSPDPVMFPSGLSLSQPLVSLIELGSLTVTAIYLRRYN